MENKNEIVKKIIDLAKMLADENTMSPAGPFQAPPPKGAKKNLRPVIRLIVEKRLEKIKKY